MITQDCQLPREENGVLPRHYKECGRDAPECELADDNLTVGSSDRKETSNMTDIGDGLSGRRRHLPASITERTSR